MIVWNVFDSISYLLVVSGIACKELMFEAGHGSYFSAPPFSYSAKLYQTVGHKSTSAGKWLLLAMHIVIHHNGFGFPFCFEM